MKKNDKFLTCKEEIKAYMGNISDYIFRKFIKEGMPARFDGGWYAYTENLDLWWKKYTAVTMKNVIDKIEKKEYDAEHKA